MTGPDMHTLAGAFALDAVSDVERAEFQRHLAQCDACAQEVAELRATAGRLGVAMAEEPPPALKPRVLAAMHATRQVPPQPRREPGTPARGRGHGSRRPMWLGVAAAVAGLVLAGTFGGIALSTHDRLTTAQQQLDQAHDQLAPVSQLLAAPDVKAGHSAASVGGGGTVLASKSLDRMMFMDAGMPAITDGRVYEAWLMNAAGVPRPAGLITGGPDGSAVVKGGLGDASQVAVSVEQAGGSPTGTPSKDVVLVMPMPA